MLDRIGYIQGLGTTSIWLTPSFKNKAVQLEDGPSGGYHGYWVTDFTQIDPHLGTNAELRALVDEAHKRGMKVYFDIISNHTADVIGYEEGARTAYVPKDKEPYRTASGTPFDDRDYAGTNNFPPLSPTVSFPYSPVLDSDEQNLKVPSWLNDVTLYHNRGNTTFTGEDSYYGDFFGLDDLFTEHPTVVAGMIEIYKARIKDMGIDGFRIDTMKHVNDEFWQRFGPEVLAYAKSRGKTEFFMFGEVFDLTRPFTSTFTTQDDAGRAGLPLPGGCSQLCIEGRAGQSAEHVLMAQVTSNGNRLLPLTVPALSTVVYQSVDRIPGSDTAPQISLDNPTVAAPTNSRMLVSANVGGALFNEVTFYAKVSNGQWKSIGTDDTRPYRVFHDISSIPDGTRVNYRAVVRDNADHQRVSGSQDTVVPAPKLTIEAPAEGAEVFGTIEVSVTADPERASHVVRIQRKLPSDSDWVTVKRDDSSPVYTYYDDLSSVPVGTVIQYRAILNEPDGTRLVSPVRTVTRTAPRPLVDSVTVAGSLQSEIGCATDWDPACAASHLTFDTNNGLWEGTFQIPGGDYEYKVAIDDSWDVNYGAGGAANGSNIAVSVPAGATSVTFVWDQVSHIVTHTVNN